MALRRQPWEKSLPQVRLGLGRHLCPQLALTQSVPAWLRYPAAGPRLAVCYRYSGTGSDCPGLALGLFAAALHLGLLSALLPLHFLVLGLLGLLL